MFLVGKSTDLIENYRKFLEDIQQNVNRSYLSIIKSQVISIVTSDYLYFKIFSNKNILVDCNKNQD